MSLNVGLVRGYLIFGDDQGQSAKTGAWLKGIDIAAKIANLSTLQEAVQACSDAAVNDGSVSVDMADPTPAAASDGAYENVEDKLVMIMYSTAGERVRYEIAAPKDTLFLADKETVNKENALVIALIQAFVALCSDKLGNVLVDLWKGYRKRAKTRQKK